MSGISPEVLSRSYARKEIRIADGNVIARTHAKKETQILDPPRMMTFPLKTGLLRVAARNTVSTEIGK
jgi:hypothetical protein